MPSLKYSGARLLWYPPGGTLVGARPSRFTPVTRGGFPSARASLLYPARRQTGGRRNRPLFSDGVKGLYFTGGAYSVNVRGKYCELALTGGYKQLCDTEIVAAYRKETAGVIPHNTPEVAGTGKTAITCPAVNTARFPAKKSSPVRNTAIRGSASFLTKKTCFVLEPYTIPEKAGAWYSALRPEKISFGPGGALSRFSPARSGTRKK